MANLTGLVPQWDLNDINRRINLDTIEFENKIIQAYNFVGQEIVNDARNKASFTDQTGNLRASIGYKVFNDNDEEESRSGTGDAGAPQMWATHSPEACSSPERRRCSRHASGPTLGTDSPLY